jgi:antitoxin component YwqK of YwqJK toxin-antitoxin module
MLISLLFWQCSGETTQHESESETEKVTFCDCKELELDQLYNRFYYVDPSEGFSGSCESYYSNQQVSERKNFKDGKLHGTVETFYENGQLNDIKHFDMNLQSGEYKKYSEDGRLLLQAEFKNGRHTETIFKDPSFEQEAINRSLTE